MQSLDIGVHCLVNKLLNRFTFSKQSVKSLLSTSRGGISGILLPFTDVLKMVQCVALGNQRCPVRVRLLAMCRGELSAVIARLMSNCEAGGSGSEELKKCPPPSPAVLWFVNVCERKPR